MLVPGHGAIATPSEFATYIEFIGSVEEAARAANRKGTPASEAWKTFRVPERLGKWGLYRPDIAGTGECRIRATYSGGAASRSTGPWATSAIR